MSVAKAVKNEEFKTEKKQLIFLVVDDDAGARQVLVEYLTSFGYTNVLEAKDGAQALQLMAKQRVDFIISDWEMPTTSGLDLLRALKNDPRFKNIPFIMVTSPISSEQNKIEDAAALNVQGYIIKPFRAEILREKVDLALSEFKFQEKKGALVVDDDEQVLETIGEYLEQLGYGPIFKANDGEEGFKTLKKNFKSIAFVVSDWEMPKLQGIDLLKKIREDEDVSETPFIMVTSQTSIERIKLRRAIEADVDNYLLKPFRVSDLKTKVDAVLNKAKEDAKVVRDLERANDYSDSGRWADAVKTFNAVLALQPNNVHALLGMAVAQKKLAPEKAIPKATQYIRKAITVNPAFDQAHIDLALTFESAMSIDKAIATLKESLKTCAFSENIHFHLGRLLLRRGLHAEGLAELKRALEIKPDFKEAEDLLAGRGAEENE